MTKHPPFILSCVSSICWEHHMVWPQARLCSSQQPILYAFLWPHLPQQPQFRFFSPSTSVKVPVSLYFSFLLIFYHFFFFVWLYSVNSGHFDLSLLIYIFQYMGWMDILLWFGFRENWRTKGLSEQVFASCYQDFVSLHRRFLQLSTLPFWKRMHDGVHKQWVWDKFCI